MMIYFWLIMVGCAPKTIALAPSALTDAVGTVVVESESTEALTYRANNALLMGTNEGYVEAIDAYEKLLERVVLPATLLNIGVAHMGLEQFSNAQIHFRDVSRNNPELAEGWLYLGAASEYMNDATGAIRVYEEGIQVLPDNRELRVAHVSALRRRGKVDEARAAATEALRLDANNLALYNNVGLAYLDSGDAAMARFVFQKANGSIAGSENDAAIQCNLGRAYFALGDAVTGRAYVERALELDPTLISALLSYSQMLMTDRAYADAVPLLERAVEANPNNVNLLVNLGVAYQGVGRGDEAIVIMERAQELDTSNLQSVFNLGLLYGDVRLDFVRAVEQLSKYTAAGGESSDRAQEYIGSFEKSQDRAAKKREAESANQRKQEELTERARILEEAAREEAAAAAAKQAVPVVRPPAVESADAEPVQTPSADDPWGVSK